eukprot:scaffold8013_cov124-Isochrysis_galbana.AAC.15
MSAPGVCAAVPSDGGGQTGLDSCEGVPPLVRGARLTRGIGAGSQAPAGGCELTRGDVNSVTSGEPRQYLRMWRVLDSSAAGSAAMQVGSQSAQPAMSSGVQAARSASCTMANAVVSHASSVKARRARSHLKARPSTPAQPVNKVRSPNCESSKRVSVMSSIE